MARLVYLQTRRRIDGGVQPGRGDCPPTSLKLQKILCEKKHGKVLALAVK